MKNIQGSAVGGDAAGPENDSARAQIQHHIEVMGGHNDGMFEGFEEFDQLPARTRVKIGGGFIHHEDAGGHGEHRSDGYRALFPGGEPVRGAVGEVGRPDRSERVGDPGFHLLRRQPEIKRAEGHIIIYRGHKQLIVGILKNHPHGPPDVFQRFLRQWHISDPDDTGLGNETPVQMQKQRRFSGAIRPHNGH